MKVLNLVLKSKWYDMIESGEKTEEYREIKPYWIKRLCQCKGENNHLRTGFYCPKATCKKCLTETYNGFHAMEYDIVCFHKGYTNTKMSFNVNSIKIGIGNKEWGALDTNVFIIKLGDKI